jgi:acyl-coenzyme A synthetase/AMP-(fatty) acid ligase/3-hydroxymyristoyl/3-hydroxydecanoyl-(acyl carrier protein) dehydratase
MPEMAKAYMTVDLLDALNAPRSASHIVAWQDGAPVRWDDFLRRVYGWETLLRHTPGSNYALYISDSIEFCAAMFGLWQAGKTAYLPADTLTATCLNLANSVDGFLGEFPAEWNPLVPPAHHTTTRAQPYPRLPAHQAGLVIYTSGSTGAAQAIPKKLAQLAAEVATLEMLFGDRAGGAGIVATVSHQHIYGLLFKVLWPLAAGRPIHARSLAFFEQLAPLLEDHACVLVSSPAHLTRLPDLPGWAKARQRLRAVFSSGGPLPLDAAQTCARLLATMPIEIYGSSETGGIAWRQRDEATGENWRPMPGVAWRIDADGVLQVCSAHLPDSAWFAMADRAVLASDGQFILEGRIDRIVKIEEKRISIDAIEQCLSASPLVAEVRVLAFGVHRQRIAAIIVPSPQGQAMLIDLGKLAFGRLLRATLADRIERVALPRRWRFLSALPVNAQGKTTHAELLALLSDNAVRPILPHCRLLEREALRAVFEVTAPHDLAYFDGHFAAAPILPGVVQVEWAIHYGRQCFDLPPLFHGIHALKFQHVIHPAQPVTLELLHDPAKSSLTFRYASRDSQHASGKILFGGGNV